MRKRKLEELGRLTVEEFKRSSKTPIILVADNLRSLHNVGALFRTGDAFRVEKIYLTGFTAVPPHREIHKTALGATESVDWAYEQNIERLIHALQRQGVTVIAAEQTDRSVPLYRYCPPPHRKVAVIFGNEVEGVSEEVLPLIDAAIEIPQFGTKHSLNVSVSAGIILWDLFAKLKFYPLCGGA